MRSKRTLLLVLSVLLLVGIACNESEEKISTVNADSKTPSAELLNVIPKDGRILELDANAPENGDFDQVLVMARELGVESIRLSVYWDDIEREPGVYDPDPNWLAIANQYYAAQDISISLTISVLDTTEVRIPSYLGRKPLSDPETILRFKDLLDYVRTQLTEVDFIYLAIGNEIDGVLGSDLSAWQDYQVFYEQTAEYARNIWPDLPISTKVTFDGLTGPMVDAARKMYQYSDTLMTTYYPLNGDFSVQDPDIIHQDFQELTDLFPEKMILITEIGYPTSSENNSSPQKQAEFIHHMFQAWDENKDQISVLSYSWLSDLSSNSVQDLGSYYGLNDQGFSEFLRTLGLRTYPGPGENKIGYETFLAESKARGW